MDFIWRRELAPVRVAATGADHLLASMLLPKPLTAFPMLHANAPPTSLLLARSFSGRDGGGLVRFPDWFSREVYMNP